MEMPVEFLIVNYKAPQFKLPPDDLKLKVGDEYTLIFSEMRDQDPDDTPSLSDLDFGKASGFISGDFPIFLIKPKDNSTAPGIYPVKVELTDDNPSSTLSTLYTFRLFVEALPANDTTTTASANATANSTENNNTTSDDIATKGGATSQGAAGGSRGKQNQKLVIKDLGLKIKSISA